MRLRRPVPLLALALSTVTLAGCGSEDKAARELTRNSIAEPSPPSKEVMVTQKTIDSVQKGSASQALLRYWSNLQHQAWADAAETYNEILLREIGPATLIEALKSQSAYFSTTKPDLEGVRNFGRGRQTVHFTIRQPDGVKTAYSMSFERADGRWRIYYDPFLDQALRASVQNDTQIALDPTARTPSKRAIQAGQGASQLQSRYLRLRREAARGGRRAAPTATPAAPQVTPAGSSSTATP